MRPGERPPDPAPDPAVEASATLSNSELGAPPRLVEAPPPERVDASRGRLVGRYVILSLLGTGGMGAVYAAYDPELDRKVALKLLRPDARRVDSARMLREARALARLAHPNVVAVHDVGTIGAELFIAMEHVEGLTVNRWLRSRERSLRELLDVYLAAGRGLAAAHRAGLVHRDFKPDNMMVAVDGRVRVLDFGLARSEHSPGAETTLEEAVVSESSGAPSQRLTGDGVLLGTPSYMAPEQWRGAVADARSDQFSFCVALWEALYGARPFRGATMHALMTAVTNGALEVPPSEPRRVPAVIRRALERGLALAPEARFASMDELLAALERGPQRQRRRLAALGAGLLALAGAGIGLIQTRRVAMCEAAGAEITAVWNESARDGLRDALLHTGVEHAASSHDKAARRVDDWTATWSATRTRVCREAEVEGERSPGSHAQAAACLDEQRDALAALLAVFGESAATDVQRLVPAVAGLPAPEPCAEPRHLARRPPLPDQPGARAQARALRQRLWRVQGLSAAGRYPEALALAETCLADAEALGHAPLAIEARLQLGNIAPYHRAAEALRRVYVEAGEIGADEMAAAAAVRLVSVLGVDLQRPAEGLQWALPAQVLIKRLGQEGGPLAASLLNNEAMVLRAQGSQDEALARFTRALEIRESVLGPDHPAVATILNNLGNLQRDRGDREAALAAHRRALEIREQVLGADHPDVSATLNNLGLLAQVGGDYATAADHLERALKIVEGSYGPDSLETATIVNNLGRLRQLRGDYGPAQADLERALAIRERELGPRHLDVATTLKNLGLLHLARGARLEARALLERVLAIRERQMDDAHPDIVDILDSLGALNYRIGDQERALALHERALKIQRARPGEPRADVAHSLRNLAQVHAARGDPEHALALAREALAIGERVLGPDHADIAAFLNTLGLLERGRDDAAAARMLERALLISQRTRGPRHPAVATSLQRLADLDLDAGALDRARTRLDEALAIRESVGPEAPEVADVLMGLARLALARERPDDAVSLLTRAVSIRGAGGVPATQLAQARFQLARATRAAGGDRARARALAAEALTELRAAGPAFADEADAVATWLRG